MKDKARVIRAICSVSLVVKYLLPKQKSGVRFPYTAQNQQLKIMNRYKNLYALIKSGKYEKIFYHITSSNNIESIMRNGIIPTRGPRRCIKNDGEDIIFMTCIECLNDWKQALMKAKHHPIIDPVIVKVDCTNFSLKIRNCYKEGIEIGCTTTILPSQLTITKL